METRIVFHIDFDYFFAQCEEIRNPELKSKPVCVCVFSDRGGDSGAIATANYTARKFGVKSGIPIVFAKKRLVKQQDAVFLPVDFDFYISMSEKGMEIMEKFADIFEYVGKDEAFLDVTKKTNGDWGESKKLAMKINQPQQRLSSQQLHKVFSVQNRPYLRRPKMQRYLKYHEYDIRIS